MMAEAEQRMLPKATCTPEAINKYLFHLTDQDLTLQVDLSTVKSIGVLTMINMKYPFR